MIFIVVKFNVLPDYQDRWSSITAEFTAATRSESGNLWFEWSRNIDDPSEFVLVEAFLDSDAGRRHANSDHFRDGLAAMRPALARTPRIVNTEVPGIDWSLMGELEIDN